MATTVEEAFREQWGRLLALLVAQYRRLDLAEDGLAEAFAIAAGEAWRAAPPDNPPAWLLTTARRKIVDRLRAEAVAARKEPLLVVEAGLAERAQAVRADPGGLVADERLRLIFLCAHPVLAPETASALTLRLVLGVRTSDVAQLFLVSEPTMAARLTRAKRKLAASGAPFQVPEGAALEPRVAGVLDVIYLGFTAGYAPGSGADVTRVELAGEAIRLARLLRELLSPRADLDALLALLLLQHSRRDARADADGQVILLPKQDRSRWRHGEIAEALALLRPLVTRSWLGVTGQYVLQVLIAAEHAVARTASETRWDRVAARYAELEALTGSPVVRLNRAVAVAEAEGPSAGLTVLAGLDDQLPRSHRLPAVRAELLARLGRTVDARSAYALALRRCGNEAEAAHLRARLGELGTGEGPLG